MRLEPWWDGFILVRIRATCAYTAEQPGGTAVFAIPLDAIAASGSGLLTLVATAADPPDWLAYLVRRYDGQVRRCG
jgi:hypothetical protein